MLVLLLLFLLIEREKNRRKHSGLDSHSLSLSLGSLALLVFSGPSQALSPGGGVSKLFAQLFFVYSLQEYGGKVAHFSALYQRQGKTLESR